MTHHSPLIARQQSVTGNAHARKKEIQSTMTALANPGLRVRSV
ncbi:MAG TPA: hypothetical protein VHT23_04095 [Gemmatimonadaceae bacterium]|nr:hypothetical protein [Gemmatimonadaceae bacterium]